MSPKCVKYKDVYAAPGSDLFQALKDGDQKKAAEFYKSASDNAKRLETSSKENV